MDVTFGVLHNRSRSPRGERIATVESKLGSFAAVICVKPGFDFLDGQINMVSINDFDRDDAGEFSALDEPRDVRITVGFIKGLRRRLNTLHWDKSRVVLDQSRLIGYFDRDDDVNIGGFEGSFVNGRVGPADGDTTLLDGVRVRDIHGLDDVAELFNGPRRV